jgi:NAD(P)-dependent dehydrogenase (short-subunit alcohol dehydrogenase family)
MSDQRVAVVTGGNRGIGLEIVRGLAKARLHVVLAARSRDAGRAAAEALAGEGLEVMPMVLDVADAGSIAAFASAVEAKLGRCDVLVNNAGIALDKFRSALEVPLSTVRATFETNVWGPVALIQAFVPLMRKHGYGRIVNVTSELGSLANLTQGTTLGYRASKTALNAVTAVVAAELKGSGILVNAAAPGWCATELGGPGATRTAAQGADTCLWLATLPDDGPTGGLFRERAVFPW